MIATAWEKCIPKKKQNLDIFERKKGHNVDAYVGLNFVSNLSGGRVTKSDGNRQGVEGFFVLAW